ncbi:MAG: NADH-quinone oxidoreductase subunit J [Thermodesulfovibrionales bacterium]|nr:NADH-quinone oxidoreductase subunit J [Thermodesulfovibrionales bacterium]
MIYLIFAYFCLSMVGITTMALTRKNPVHAVLWLLLLFLHVAVVYLFLNAEFLSMAQIIVYAGAILVMFLFTIFFIGAKELSKEKRYIKLWEGRLLIGLAMTAAAIVALSKIKTTFSGKYTISFIEKTGNTYAIGEMLFNEYSLAFFMVGVILLIPMIAVGVIARKLR